MMEKQEFKVFNNFNSIMYGIVFWLLFNGMILYFVFYGSVIDWSQDIEWYLILHYEMKESARFGTILFLYLPINLSAFYALYKVLKKPKVCLFYDNRVKCTKTFNELTELNTDNIITIKRGLFPLLATGYTKTNFASLIGITVGFSFLLLSEIVAWIIRFFIWILFKIFTKKKAYITFFPYITIFVKNTNRVINLHCLTQEEYLLVKEFFWQNRQIDIDSININFRFSNLDQN